MNGVVVIGGHTQGLGLTRMLGTQGISVVLMDNKKYNMARYSKYCTDFIEIPSEDWFSEESFCSYLKKNCIQYDLFNYLLFPTDDRSVGYISKNKEELSKYYKIWLPDWNVVERCYNKRLTYLLAKELGIPIPYTIFLERSDDIENVIKSLTYPVILKPTIVYKFYEITKKKVIVVQNAQDLLNQYDQLKHLINPSEIMIQEIIPGSPSQLYSLGCFTKNGKVIAYIMGRRKRQIPMDFGKASTFVELINIPEILELGQCILEALEYYGLCEVEFKYDIRDQKFKLLEINPRSWKWHSLSILAGLNLPYMLYTDMFGIPIKEHDYGPALTSGNGKWIDEYSDLYMSVVEILKGNLSVGEYWNSIKGKKTFGALSLEDPLPFIMETLFIPILARR